MYIVKSSLRTSFALILMAVSVICFAAGEKDVAEAQKDEITVALSADIASLDPQGHNDTKSETVSFLLFNRLFRLNTDFEVIPDLAESWDQESLTEWVIKIKKGVKFHNGNEMTSADVKASLDRSKEMPKVQQVLSEVKSIEIIDKYSVRVITNTAFAPFLYTLVHAGTSIIPKDYIESDDNFANPIGSGPYTFKEWLSGDQVVLEKNNNYYDKNNMGQSSRLIFKVIPEGTSRTIALETGEVDIIPEIPTTDKNKISDNANLKLYEKPSTRLDFFEMNTEKSPFDNIYIRQAMNYAIDKEAVLIVAIEGAGIPADSILAPSFLGYKPGPYSYNPEKAKELMAKGGYPDGFEMKITTSGDDRKRIAEVIQASLMEVGITASIEMLEWSTFIDSAIKGDHQALVLGWTSNPDPDATLTPRFFSGNIDGMNFSRINDPQLDKLLKEGREELDIEKRKKIYNSLHEYAMELGHFVPLFVKNNLVGANSKLKGVELSPQGLWNIEKLHY